MDFLRSLGTMVWGGEEGQAGNDAGTEIRLGTRLRLERPGDDDLSIIAMEEVAAHNAGDEEDSKWLILGGRVYEIGLFLEEHPGGPEILLDHLNVDAEKEFEDIFHSHEAFKMLLELPCVGRIGTAPLVKSSLKGR
jgi:Cytochrome b5-like Heme/Steroid binding domain